jgi:cellobiose phosphorylase
MYRRVEAIAERFGKAARVYRWYRMKVPVSTGYNETLSEIHDLELYFDSASDRNGLDLFDV